MLDRNFLYLTGLPGSGVGFLSQLLAQHPDIYSSNLPSPLGDILVNFRSFVSTNSQVANHLNQEFNLTMERSLLAMRGLINGWYSPIFQPWIVDIHPQWLQHLELIHLLDPNCRIVVCVRELGQVYAAIENQHQKTLLLDFPEKLAEMSRTERAQQLFAPQGAIGSFLKSLEQLQDLEESLEQQLFYVVYEHLMSDPNEVLTELVNWLNLAPISPDFTKINQELPNYSESSGKYVEESYNPNQPLVYYTLPKRFEVTIKQNFGWFYRIFYPGQL
ncbi:sulfotransferase [Aerosakkonemataceae cyanobacterium BLCC-F154]|uniref:Sulfotransferase n=1 Tax=Floridaenema fluviatile BLCC-F154 TaxID=3153640 RepID=A0ABV4Y654_9CYAN